MTEPDRLLVATDLDGSLLDADDYSHAAARPALAALAERGAMLVLASSKTRAEVAHLARELGQASPLIVENGGALLVPRGTLSCRVPGARRSGSYELVALGEPRPRLLAALAEIAAETGARLRGFASLEPREIGRITGLSPDAIRRARRRQWDEPFFLADPTDAERVAEAARARGLTVTRGGLFHHLTGGADKGKAFELLLRLLGTDGQRFSTLGLGDAANDLSLLERVDRPILLPRPGGWVDGTLAAALPWAERAPLPGAAGWNAAVLAVLSGERLPVVAGQPAARLPV